MSKITDLSGECSCCGKTGKVCSEIKNSARVQTRAFCNESLSSETAEEPSTPNRCGPESEL